MSRGPRRSANDWMPTELLEDVELKPHRVPPGTFMSLELLRLLVAQESRAALLMAEKTGVPIPDLGCRSG